MKKFTKKQKICFILMMILLIISGITLRVDIIAIQVIGLILFIFSVIVGFIMLKEKR